MKSRYYLIVFLFLFLIPACSQKLGKPKGDTHSVLMIPTDVTTLTNWEYGYSVTFFAFRLDDVTKETVEEHSGKITIGPDKKYVVINNLPPGFYSMKGFRYCRLKMSPDAIRYQETLEVNYDFILEPGTITLFQRVLSVTQRDVGIGFRYDFLHREISESEKDNYRLLIEKEENIKNWKLSF